MCLNNPEHSHGNGWYWVGFIGSLLGLALLVIKPEWFR